MPITIAHRSPRDACSAVEAVARDSFDHLSPRPWNMFEPDTSLWWLVPATEWPAYAYGKLAFNWLGDNRSRLLAGANWEKGLDKKVRAAYPSAKGSRLIMGHDWQWHRLLAAVADGTLERLTREFAAALDAPLVIKISGRYVDDPDGFDPYNTLLKMDEFWLAWDPARGVLTLRQSLVEGDVLGDLGAVDTFERLSSELKRLTADAWLWANVYYSLEFPIAPADPAAWTGADLWANYLKRFRTLLV